MYGSRPTPALRAVYVGEAVGVFSSPSCQESQRRGLTSCRARNTGPKPVIEISSAGNVLPQIMIANIAPLRLSTSGRGRDVSTGSVPVARCFVS